MSLAMHPAVFWGFTCINSLNLHSHPVEPEPLLFPLNRWWNSSVDSAHGHTASEWRNWDLNTRNVSPEPERWPLCCCEAPEHLSKMLRFWLMLNNLETNRELFNKNNFLIAGAYSVIIIKLCTFRFFFSPTTLFLKSILSFPIASFV